MVCTNNEVFKVGLYETWQVQTGTEDKPTEQTTIYRTERADWETARAFTPDFPAARANTDPILLGHPSHLH